MQRQTHKLVQRYFDRNLVYDMHNGDYTVTVGTSSVDRIITAEIKVRDKQILTID